MGYKVNGVDVLAGIPTKESFFDIYPSLSNVFRSPALLVWGNNSYGQLGNNTNISYYVASPAPTIAGGTDWKQVSIGYHHTAAIKTDGTLWLCGYNGRGQLGDYSTAHKSSPVQTITGGTNWKQVAGSYHTAAIKTDGTLWTWGYNIVGQLGDNTIDHKSSPVQTAAGGTNWKQVSCGRDCTAAIKTDGTLWTWGNNTYGQLGDNTILIKSSPAPTIAGGTNWAQVSGGFYHTAAIKTDGTLWSWGLNWHGQLGDNTATLRSSPVQTVAGGTNWKQVSCGQLHTAAIKIDGTLWTWGYNIVGQLGDNTIAYKSSPVQTVAGGTNWKQVSGGRYYTAAIKTDGTLWIWGANQFGSLGNYYVASTSSPVQTVAGGTNWKQVSCGYYHTAAIAEDDPFL